MLPSLRLIAACAEDPQHPFAPCHDTIDATPGRWVFVLVAVTIVAMLGIALAGTRRRPHAGSASLAWLALATLGLALGLAGAYLIAVSQLDDGIGAVLLIASPALLGGAVAVAGLLGYALTLAKRFRDRRSR